MKVEGCQRKPDLDESRAAEKQEQSGFELRFITIFILRACPEGLSPGCLLSKIVEGAMTSLSRIILLVLFVLSCPVALAWDDEEDFWAPTPPRLSFIDGQVSYWREGADDWVVARRNLPLAQGDSLYAGSNSNFEVQFDSRSFVRADENTQLSLVSQEERYLQFKLTRGLASFDMRSMAVGDNVEVSTPDAVFIIEQPGYYRVEVGNRETRFITRRGGRATLGTADGRSLSVYPSEEIVVTAGNPVQVATYAAPPEDAWDRWNDARSDRIGEAVSTRYLPPDVYGTEDLDYYGYWRVVPEYGAVWIPRSVGLNWAPYSAGTWVWDPYYEWTWIDDAPWGWAPFHYGRWIYVGGYWAWAPGPVVRRSVYAPALVAFLVRGHDVSVRVSVGLPGLWWVALSWGEPVLPWWGHHRHRWHPRWAGWGGPRIVNNVVIKQTTIININEIHYHNARQPRAILTAPADKFGRAPIRATAETRYRQEDFVPVRSEMPVKPVRESLFGGASKATRPPREAVTRPVVATRPPRATSLPWLAEKPRVQPQAAQEPRYVKPPQMEEGRPPAQRPPFGAAAGPERARSPQPPRLKEVAAPSAATPGAGRSAAPAPTAKPATTAPAQPPRTMPAQQPSGAQRAPVQVAPARVEPRQESKAQPLPGKPANQTYRGQEQNVRSWEQRGER
jgi:hypothetical protein